MAGLDQARIARAARGLAAYRNYAAVGYEMTKYSLPNQSKIERVARALYDAAPFERAADEQEDTRAEQNDLLWEDIDEDSKQEFRAMAAISIEAMTDELDESLRQFQLPAVMSELTSLSKADALRVLNAAIEQIMEAK